MKNTKPKCKLVGTDGNVFNIIGLVAGALRKAGMDGKAKEFTTRAFGADSYDAVLRMVSEYVEVR